MPDVPIQIEGPDGSQINEVRFGRVIQRLPSAALSLSLRNLDDSSSFSGEIFVAPSSGPSYAGDLEISSDGSSWGRSLDAELAPGEAMPFRVRAHPKVTPPGVFGRARICVRGQWLSS